MMWSNILGKKEAIERSPIDDLFFHKDVEQHSWTERGH
jgi:hypothetical protein